MTKTEFKAIKKNIPDEYYDQDWGFKVPMSEVIGKRYGNTPEKYLEVLGCDHVKFRSNGDRVIRERMLLCLCHKCNKTKIIRYSTVINNMIATCGCSMKDEYEKRIKRFNKGDRFGIITATGKFIRQKTNRGTDDIKWEFVCDCGNTRYFKYPEVINRDKGKYPISCGCLANQHHGDAMRTHGATDSHLYNVYHLMVSRCTNPNNPKYANWGGRGITICSEWYDPNETRRDKFNNKNEKFLNFVKWACANGYYDQPKDTPRNQLLTLDRIDNDGPYAPWNCRWVTLKIQANNTTKNRHVRYNGKVYTYAQFRELLGMKSHGIFMNALKSDALDMHIWNMLHPDDPLHHVGHGAVTKYKDKDGFYRMLPRYKVEFID